MRLAKFLNSKFSFYAITWLLFSGVYWLIAHFRGDLLFYKAVKEIRSQNFYNPDTGDIMPDNEVTNALEEFPVSWLISLGIDKKNAAVIGSGFEFIEIKEETLF